MQAGHKFVLMYHLISCFFMLPNSTLSELLRAIVPLSTIWALGVVNGPNFHYWITEFQLGKLVEHRFFWTQTNLFCS